MGRLNSILCDPSVAAFVQKGALASLPLCRPTASSSVPVQTLKPKPTSAVQDPPLPPEPPRLVPPKQQPTRQPLATTPRWDLLTNTLAGDCEFAQMYDPITGEEWHVLASVSIINECGEVVYDTYTYHPDDSRLIKKLHPPDRKFGVVYEDLKPENGAQPYDKVCEDVRRIVEARIVVGHAFCNDTSKFPEWVFEGVETRDTQLYEPYRVYARGSRRLPRLGVLAQQLLGEDIWKDGHTSVGDAQATMKLYLLNKSGIDDAQRDGYTIENRAWGYMDPNDTDTEQEALARVLRSHKEAIFAQNQARIEEAAAVELPRESLTPFRHATDFWLAGVDELKDLLRPAGRSNRTAQTPNEALSAKLGVSLTLTQRSLARLDMDDKEWDGKLLVDDIGPEPSISLPGTRRPFRPSDRAGSGWRYSSMGDKIDNAWWLGASIKVQETSGCRDGDAQDCNEHGGGKLTGGMGRQPWKTLPAARVLGECSWPQLPKKDR